MNTNKDIQGLSDEQIIATYNVNGLDVVRTVRAILATRQTTPVASTPAMAGSERDAALSLETLLACAQQAGLGKFWLDGDKMPRSDGYLIGQDFFTRLHERIVAAQTKESSKNS